MKLLVVFLVVLLVGCAQVTEKKEIPKNSEVATIAGGCFWCIEALFQDTEGVLDAVSGYSGGTEANPTYKEVSAGKTGHLETVQVTFDPSIISYKEILEFFWRNIDPTDDGGQFNDRGESYKSAIFYHDEEQKKIAEQTKKELADSGRFDKPIATKIIKFEKFYEAEEYHQDYYLKAPLRYNFYKKASGRDKFREQNWENDESGFEKPTDEELRASLTEIQYKVTQEDGTEIAFDNEHWDNEEEGIYVDVVSGEPLFSSKDKFKSGTGWPSFTKPLEPANIVEKKDFKIIIPRTEVRSKHADSHLGHIFKDGPEPTGKRYCMNSAALRFIPKDKLKEEGYEEYLELFSK